MKLLAFLILLLTLMVGIDIGKKYEASRGFHSGTLTAMQVTPKDTRTAAQIRHDMDNK